MPRFIDVHAEKRKALKLFQAVEPVVILAGATEMYSNESSQPTPPNEIPGFVARMSHGSTGTSEENEKLTKKLLTFNPPHATPFEFMQWIFKITGVSKSCLTQFDRNRIGIGFVQMSGRYMDSSQRGFVYTAYAEKEWDVVVDNKPPAISRLNHDSVHYEQCMRRYNQAREFGCTKQDARKNLPLAMATGTYVHMNSRSLKTFLNERLRPSAEWEIRRMAQMMLDIVYAIAPAHFEAEKEIIDS